jgi:death-on-curing protein
MDPTFFSVDDVLRFHEICIERDGGLANGRDLGWLTSAVMMPRPMFASSYRHQVLAAMAAAYLYHLSRDHPLLDSKTHRARGAGRDSVQQRHR